MHSFIYFRSRGAYLTATAAGLWASSTRLETRTTAAAAAEPLRSSPRAAKTKGKGKRRTSAGDSEKKSPFPPPTGPMVAVFLDQPSVDKLKAQYPEARDGQLRKVVLQFSPSASEREMYRHLLSSRAEVTVTGDASSAGRRALVVSVSHAGDEVKPMSLSAAIDISPELDVGDAVVAINDGPGPLASTVLIHQIKQAGATKKELWQGMLSPLLAHGRQFPSEEGAHVRLQEPISVSGTICRADWVDGASTRCRNTVGTGEQREEDWKASTCAVCKHFEASPCGEIFRRFLAASRRHAEKLKASNKPEARAPNEEMGKEDTAETQRSVQGDKKAGNGSERVVAAGREHARKSSQKNRSNSSGRARRKTKGGGGGESPGGKGQKETGQKGGKRLSKPGDIFQELRECSIFHDV